MYLEGAWKEHLNLNLNIYLFFQENLNIVSNKLLYLIGFRSHFGGIHSANKNNDVDP